MQVAVPEELRGIIIMACHEAKEGHQSAMKTYQKVRERFYWPGCFADCVKVVRHCAECQLNSQLRSKAPVLRHIESSEPGAVWVIDLLHYPTAEGFKYVLVEPHGCIATQRRD